MRIRIFGVLLIVLGAMPAIAAPLNSVLLTGENAAILVAQCSRESPDRVEGTWQPDAGVIARMESRITAIQSLTSEGCCGRGRRISDVTSYYLQFGGIIWRGRRLIYINALAGEMKGWRQRPVMVCDGGIGFWGVLYDPATGRFFALAINGEA